MSNKYCNSLTSYSRFVTREVKLGDVPLGGANPIRIQSMTTTDTMDTLATVNQSIRMIESGCEYVRITAPSKKEAENLAKIKKELRSRGFNTPLVADIHFTPNAAEIAARIVEKVRVNPGNYADKKKFQELEYTELEYDNEIERIRERFTPLVRICKEEGTAMRIGTNHGSLSDRIMTRYGDTPLGMVESALEFLRICEDESYHNIVLSMKASNPIVMVQAYRLLVNKMISEGMNYPLHLGVTEAGEGEDGRIKSAVGIGTLLEDGLGDTVRVSLTEEPEYEAPVAAELISRYANRKDHDTIPPISKNTFTPFEFNKRKTKEITNIGGENIPRVIADLSDKKNITPANLFAFGYNYSKELDKWNLGEMAVDYVYIGDQTIDFGLPGTLGIITTLKSYKASKKADNIFPLVSKEDLTKDGGVEKHLTLFVKIKTSDLTDDFFELINNYPSAILVLETSNDHAMADFRRAFFELVNSQTNIPIIVKRNYDNISTEQFQLWSSTDVGGLLVDGFGDGIWVTTSGEIPNQQLNSTCFGILQATRTRISKTEYISCPSCGRTLFDLQETTAKIRAVTDHLKGVKIGIMGCIVNGPGEMADADYGYVGTGQGKITLYKGKEVVQRNIPSEGAVDALIDLIKDHGDWVEKSAGVLT